MLDRFLEWPAPIDFTMNRFSVCLAYLYYLLPLLLCKMYNPSSFRIGTSYGIWPNRISISENSGNGMLLAQYLSSNVLI